MSHEKMYRDIGEFWENTLREIAQVKAQTQVQAKVANLSRKHRNENI